VDDTVGSFNVGCYHIGIVDLDIISQRDFHRGSFDRNHFPSFQRGRENFAGHCMVSEKSKKVPEKDVSTAPRCFLTKAAGVSSTKVRFATIIAGWW
jgi:hypothetical protein